MQVKRKAREDPNEQAVMTVMLDDYSNKALAKELAALPDPAADIERAIERATRALALVPGHVVAAVRYYKSDPSAPGALLVGNLPRDPSLPATPSDGMRATGKRTFVSEYTLLIFAILLGEVYGYAEEKDGAYFHDVAPNPRKAGSISNEGAEVDFQFHTEVAALLFRPSFILLNCLRADHERKAVTCVADARDAVRLLKPEEVAALRRREFFIRMPESFGRDPSDLRWTEGVAVLSGPESSPQVRLNFNFMRALTAEGAGALEALKRALETDAVLREVRLRPGELLAVNNRKSVHGRKPFTPRFDGHDRWLQRVYVAADLWPGRAGVTRSARIFSLRSCDDAVGGETRRGNVISVGD